MWNTKQRELFRDIKEGVGELVEARLRYDLDQSWAIKANSSCLNLDSPADNGSLDPNAAREIDSICHFLFSELAVIRDDFGRPKGEIELDAKLNFLGRSYDRPKVPRKLTRAFRTHQQATLKMRSAPTDCLCITGLPLEFRALVRRLDYLYEGSDPEKTRGFRDSEDDKPTLPLGWVRGVISNGRRSASVVIACSARYGPIDAALAGMKMLSSGRPKHILVVGIGASLGTPSEFGLGDIGISNHLFDITLGKAETLNIETDFILNGSLCLERVPESLSPWLTLEDRKLVVRGILSAADALGLADLLDDDRDKEKILSLPVSTRSRAERLNLHENAVSIAPSGGPDQERLLEVARELAIEGTWAADIHVPRPDGELGALPRARQVTAISGSNVVKQIGMRSYLKEQFPDALLVEMEAAGVARASSSPSPIIIKAACDWATPTKEKTWQPYCADVAAAFTRALIASL